MKSVQVMGGSAKVLLVSLLAGIAGFAGAATAQEQVKVSALLGVTGPLASLDVPTAAGIELAAKQINDAGGFTVGGKKYMLKAIIEDVQGRPEQAVGMARRLVQEQSSIAILGPVASSLSVPVVEVSQPRMLQLTPATITQKMIGEPGKELLFNTLNPQYGPSGIAPKYVEWLKSNVIEKHAIKKIAMLLPNDAFGQLQLDFFTKAFADLGVTVTGTEIFEPKTADFSARITKLKGDAPDALFWGYTDEVGKTIIRQSIELGLTKKFIAAPGPSGAAAADQAALIDFAVWPSSVVSLYNTGERVKAFVAAYEVQVGRKINPGDQFALYIHDATHMLVKAMEKAGTVSDSAKIAAALRGMSYEGVSKVNVSDKGQFFTDWDVGYMSTGGKIDWTTVKTN